VNAFEKLVREGTIDGAKFVEIARSEPIPNPPLAMWSGLDQALKQRLRDVFGSIHNQPGVTPEMILSYGGKVADRYDTSITDAFIEPALKRLAIVTDEVRADIVRSASMPQPSP
jgi:phosphonate transport system substrate-binding protein